MNQHSFNRQNSYRLLIGTALALTNLFQLSLPVFAAGTPAGLDLKNRATGSYDDGTDTYEVISNEVTVTVGKVAGLTNEPGTYVDSTPATALVPGDTVQLQFIVTNTGNDVTDIFIPSATSISNYSENITININDATSVQYFVSTDLTTPIDRPADGIVSDVAEDDFIIVQVTGVVSGPVGADLKVSLGHTNDNTPVDPSDPNFQDTQNQPDAGGASDPQADDVRTLTSATATVAGDPINGQREASGTHVIAIGANPLALSRIEKTNAGVVDSLTPLDLSDDVITYNLELDVLAQKLARYNNFNFNPAALRGRNYSAAPATFTDNATLIVDTNLVLISDAIPESTTLVDLTSVTEPDGWTKVYTKTSLTTPADEAEWNTDPDALTVNPGGDITRVGWIYDARGVASGTIAPGTTITGFSFQVVTDGLSNTATSVYNMAQVFGSSVGGGGITFDESGDENPNNFNDDGTSGLDETTELGVIEPPDDTDPANLDEDNNNTKTGSAGGEANVILVSPSQAPQDLLNGPFNQPGAEGDVFGTGTADSNKDFQNLAGAIPTATDQLGQADPDTATITAATTVTFTNTLQNTETGDVSDVLIEPTNSADFGLDVIDTQLPDNTIVTIVFDRDGPDEQSAIYDYTQAGGFVIQGAGTPVTVTVPGTNAGVGNNEITYEVDVTLPANTQLSTNVDGTGNVQGGYPVPIVAYIDSGTAGLDTDDIYNVTIDQVYLGYVRLEKKARVLEDDGSGNFTVVNGMDYDEEPVDGKIAAPGNRIEYEVTYTNISETQGIGSNNGLLNAENLKIIEDGTGNTVADNNWATDDNGDGAIDTLHVSTGAVATNGGTISYFSDSIGNTPSSDADSEVTKYEVEYTNTIVPGGTGAFTFQRKITTEEDINDLNP